MIAVYKFKWYRTSMRLPYFNTFHILFNKRWNCQQASKASSCYLFSIWGHQLLQKSIKN